MCVSTYFWLFVDLFYPHPRNLLLTNFNGFGFSGLLGGLWLLKSTASLITFLFKAMCSLQFRIVLLFWSFLYDKRNRKQGHLVPLRPKHTTDWPRGSNEESHKHTQLRAPTFYILHLGKMSFTILCLFCLMSGHGLKGPQKRKTYCDNMLGAILSFTSVFIVRSGAICRQDLAILSPEGSRDSTFQVG